MSQVKAQVFQGAQLLAVVAGYDPPLGVYFLDVFDATEPDEPIYESMYQHPLGLSQYGEAELRADLKARQLPALTIMAAVQALGRTANTVRSLGVLS